MAGPLNPVPQVLSVTLQGTVSERPWANVLHYAYTGTPPTASALGSFGTQIGNSWGANMASTCPSPIALVDVKLVDLTSPSSAEFTQPAAHTGTRGDDTLGANTSMLVTYPETLRYRGGHPRTYLICLGNADNADAQTWHAAAVLEVQGKWQVTLNSLIGFSAVGCTISSFGFVRYHGRFLPNSGPPHFYLNNPIYTPLQISQATCQPLMASQRRRIGRVRR
jgi:hypothetical protein